MAIGSMAQHGAPPGATQETAGTSNPSNEANVNSEFIDVGRKIPRILCERYELTDVLGKGAHGRIYLATDLVTHDRVAIKLVSFKSNELYLNVSLHSIRHSNCFIFNRWRNRVKTNPSFKERSRSWKIWWSLLKRSHLRKIAFNTRTLKLFS